MSILNDSGILEAIRVGELSITPLPANRIQPASVDLSLSEDYAIHESIDLDFSELSKENLNALEKKRKIGPDGLILRGGESVVCYTQETLTFSKQICGILYNRSSIVRWGIDAAKANFINPGFSGRMPLVIHNFGSSSIALKVGMLICQLQLNRLETQTIHSYNDRHDPSVFGKEALSAGFSRADLIKRADDPLSKFLHEKISEVTTGK